MLVADDGSRTILDRDYVFGRDPSQDPAVTSGRATPVRVQDPDGLISRVQARVAASLPTVTVSDANSANGTYIAAPGAAEWTRIGTVHTLLPLGWSLRLGARVFTHRPADAGPVDRDAAGLTASIPARPAAVAFNGWRRQVMAMAPGIRDCAASTPQRPARSSDSAQASTSCRLRTAAVAAASTSG